MKRAGRTRIAAVLAVGALAAVAGGCGGGGGGGGTLSKADYAKQLTSIANEVKSLNGIQAGGVTADKIARVRAALNHAADRLSKLKPPSNVKADNKALESSLRQLASALGPVEKAYKDKNPAEAQGAVASLQSATRKFQNAVNDLNSKGYRTTG
jgi:hypothetical protein